MHECCRAIDRGEALLCFLARDCDLSDYTKLVQALCTMRGVRIINTINKSDLGQYAGLCRVSDWGYVRKIVRTSVVVITNYGERTEHLDWLENEYNKA